jgi:hypothetical protein
MESLRSLLVKNQSYLGKLRARAIYCNSAIKEVEADFHKQYGPFAGYWDEWMMQADEMLLDLHDNIIVTDEFLAELLDFITTLQDKKRLTKTDKSYLLEVTSLAEDKLIQQVESLKAIDERIAIHKDLTEQLHLVDVLDGLGDE